MPAITIANKSITYTVKYQKRKTVQLKILDADKLEIAAPKGFTTSAIETILMKKSKWLANKISQFKQIAANPVNKSVKSGAKLLYLGQPHTVHIISRSITKPVVSIQNKTILLELTESAGFDANVARLALKQWYVQQAADVLSHKTMFWSNKLNVKPQRIVIKEQKTRWGSCSSLGNINYNWRIIMAPPEVVDYLVVHELSHLLIPNHSHDFWQQVGNYIPNYQQCRNWLRLNGALLNGPV